MPIGVEDFNIQDATVRLANWRNLRRVDWFLLLVVLALAITGWFTLYSAGRSTDVPYVFRQMQGFAAGALLAAVVIALDYRFLVAIAPIMYTGAILVLLAVISAGEARQGSMRWLQVLGVEVQPSEFTKVIMIYFLTWYLTTVGERIRKLHWFLLAFVLTGIPVVLILKQPNLGTAMTLLPLVFVMLFVAGARYWHLAAIVLCGFSVVPLVWMQMQGFDPNFRVTDADASRVHGNQDGNVSYEEFARQFCAQRVPAEVESTFTAADEVRLERRNHAAFLLLATRPDGGRMVEGVFETPEGWHARLDALRQEGYASAGALYDPGFLGLSLLDSDRDGAISPGEFQALDKNGDGAISKEDKGRFELYHHQKKRIYAFLDPEADKDSTGWQTHQSKITVGSGGFSGKGYLQGTQTMLSYLPEHHTDFIFSLLAEEHGFVGVAIVIGLFVIFLLRGLSYAGECPEMMGTLLATGVVTVLAFHIFVNIAITVGMLPVTGIPLPFLSYGRSFYLTTMICVGILLNVPMRRRVFVNQ